MSNLVDRLKEYLRSEGVRVIPWVANLVIPSLALPLAVAVASYSVARKVVSSRIGREASIDEMIDGLRLQIVELDRKLKTVGDERAKQILLSEREKLCEYLRRLVRIRSLLDVIRSRDPKLAKEIEKFVADPTNVSKFANALKKLCDETERRSVSLEEVLSRMDRLIDEAVYVLKSST